MAFPKLRALPDATDAITPIGDDPAFAAASSLLQAFAQRADLLDKERSVAALEFYFAGRAPQKDTQTDEQNRGRLARLRAELASASPQPASPASSPSPAITTGIDLLSGKPVAPVADHAGRMAELDRRLAVISAANNEQSAIVETIRGELSFEANKRIVPQWNARLTLPRNSGHLW
jgi:hypothetical protein